MSLFSDRENVVIASTHLNLEPIKISKLVIHDVPEKLIEKKGDEIQSDIISFMKDFKKDKIVAMYEPGIDKQKFLNMYRIQLHFCNDKINYSNEDHKKILQFFKKYFLQGYKVFLLFEQIFCQLICENLKNINSKEFRQINDKKDQDGLTLDSYARQSHMNQDVYLRDCSEDYNSKKFKSDYSERYWLTLNKKYDENNRWCKWDEFYDSLSKGFGTIGFEDYVTGITVRGAMTPVTGEIKYSYARNQEKRFKEKFKTLYELLGLDQNELLEDFSKKLLEDPADNCELGWKRYIGITTGAIFGGYMSFFCAEKYKFDNNKKAIATTAGAIAGEKIGQYIVEKTGCTIS